MLDHPVLFLTALLLFLFGLVSRLSGRSLVTGPMFFMGVGILLSPLGFNIFEFQYEAPAIRMIAEVALIIILFIEASKIRVTRLGKTLSGIPARLLLIGLPLTMALGTAVAWVMFPSINIWLIALVALILSPTDAALAQAVVKNKNIPARIRESISIESGLNDGIVLPLILVCIAVLAEGSQVIDYSGRWLYFMALQLGLGPIIGGLVGLVGGKIVDKAVAKDWMEPTFQNLAAISLALLAYAFAELVHGNGFIAAFFSGLFLGAKTPVVRERIQEFGEAEGKMLSLFIFLILGLVGVPAAVPHLDGVMLLYAMLSLTLIRMVPVALSLLGSGLDRSSVIFIGWFGPRGIASILYLLIAVGELGAEGYRQAISVIVITVAISTVLHGISAVPMTKVFKT
jgi:NhaP-type Na+/H+ or K+/H+ antiporter